MTKPPESQPEGEREGLLSKYHLLTLYIPAVVLALGHGVAAPTSLPPPLADASSASGA
jgi:hypothetical protein